MTDFGPEIRDAPSAANGQNPAADARRPDIYAYGSMDAIQRALGIIQRLAAAPKGRSLTDLAEDMRVNKPTVFRTLASLENAGYVEQDPVSQYYRLTLKIASVAFALLDSMGLEEVCQPYLDDLARETGELVQLAVVQSQDMIFAAKAEGTQRVKVVPELGRRVTLHASAAAKTWLASLPEDEAIRIVTTHGMSRNTPSTITRVADFLAELELTRQRGYGTSVQEFWDDVNAVGAPVRSGRTRRRVVAAIAVAGPAARLPEERLHALGPRVIDVADAIGAIWPL